MKKYSSHLTLLLISLLAATLTGCGSSDNGDVGDSSSNNSLGVIYTSTNDPSGNSVIALNRFSDGTLNELQTTFTGGVGDADDGDFDGQWSLRLIDIGARRFLLAVNAGDHEQSGITTGNGSITVFEANVTNGRLTRVGVYDSGGVRPVSIAYTTTNNQTWVFIGNQLSNPACTSSTPTTFMECGINFTDLATSSQNRNITAFLMDSVSGALSNQQVLKTFSGLNGGVSQLDVKDNILAATLWGVPQFGVTSPTLTNNDTTGISTVEFYNIAVSGVTLTLTSRAQYKRAGVSGSIGFEWDRRSSVSDDRVFVSNFNLSVERRDQSVSVISVSSTAATLTGFSGTNGDNDEACWVLANNDNIYVASFGGNIVSVFDVASDGTLSPRQISGREINIPAGIGDNKDMYIAGNYFYLSGALNTHRILTYSLESNGLLSVPRNVYTPVISRSSTQTETIPAMFSTFPLTEQAYLGLVGFDF